MSEFYDFLDHATDESERKRKYNGKTDCSSKRIICYVRNDADSHCFQRRSTGIKGDEEPPIPYPEREICLRFAGANRPTPRPERPIHTSIARGMRHDSHFVPSIHRLFDPSACEQHSRCVEKSWRLSNSDIAHVSRSQNRITDAEVGKPKYRLRGANTCQQPNHFYFLIETFVQRHDPTASIQCRIHHPKATNSVGTLLVSCQKKDVGPITY